MKSIAKALILAALLAWGLSNALAQTVNYSHSNIYTTEAQFTADRYQCVRETQQQVTIADFQAGFYGGTSGQATTVVLPNCDLFQQCLAVRGYTRWDAGYLWAQPLRCFNPTYRRFEVR